MEICDEATATFMGQALLSHAREIRRYAQTFCQPTLANQAIDAGHKRKFLRTAERMVNGMSALLLMAKHRGVSRYCNQEQVEAYMDEARAVIALTNGGGAPSRAATAFSPSLSN